MQNRSAISIRAITAGPKQHWFGYYDKLQFDPTERYVLGMQVNFEHRSPRPEDLIRIGMIDLGADDRWIDLGDSCAWGWQQGCMLQWLPGPAGRVVWNDRQDDHFVCHILEVETRRKRTLPHAIYALSPNGRSAIGTDFRRINDMRPGYGYAGIPDPNHSLFAPHDSGIYALDLETGVSTGLISIAQVAAIPSPHADLTGAKHYFNHLLFNPDGTRFIFLHRWRVGEGGFQTRMMTAAADGSDIRVIDDYGHTSHFIWRDPEHILAWSRHPSHGWAFYLYRDGAREVEVIGKGVMTLNGHCTYLPAGGYSRGWILNDSYAGQSAERRQQLYLYDVAGGTRIDLGAFYSPPAYDGEWRCDLHPRSSRDGRLLTIDSTHRGDGRQIYLLDIAEILDRQ